MASAVTQVTPRFVARRISGSEEICLGCYLWNCAKRMAKHETRAKKSHRAASAAPIVAAHRDTHRAVRKRRLNFNLERSVLENFLCSHLGHHDPRHFGIEPANAIDANDKVGWIENLPLDEAQHRAIDPRPFRLH
jgi:hypothetical protein